jgi:hypothetical protein
VITSGSVITGAKVTEHEVKMELDADVLFDSDNHNLRPEAEYAQDTWRLTRKRQENSMVALDTIQTKRSDKIMHRSTIGENRDSSEPTRRSALVPVLAESRRSPAVATKQLPEWWRRAATGGLGKGIGDLYA